jgi:hypothetical protein
VLDVPPDGEDHADDAAVRCRLRPADGGSQHAADLQALPPQGGETEDVRKLPAHLQ